MKKHILKGENRIQVGQKVKSLRLSGNIPGTIYGKGIHSQNVCVQGKEFQTLIKEVGESGLITLVIGSEEHPVLINTIQKNPVTGDIIHLEFHQVNLKEKVKTNVPIEFIGEPLAVKENVGTLLQLLSEVEVEALPENIPEKISVDVSHMAQVNDTLFTKNLTLPSEVTLLTDPELIIAKIGQLLAPEPEPTPEVTVPLEESETATEEGKEAGTGEKSAEVPQESAKKEETK